MRIEPAPTVAEVTSLIAALQKKAEAAHNAEPAYRRSIDVALCVAEEWLTRRDVQEH